MASCSPFSIKFSGSASELFQKITSLMKSHGGSVSGDETKGTFSVPTPIGAIAGTYAISGQECTIHITQRSFFLPCKTIKSFIEDNIPKVQKADIAELH